MNFAVVNVNTVAAVVATTSIHCCRYYHYMAPGQGSVFPWCVCVMCVYVCLLENEQAQFETMFHCSLVHVHSSLSSSSFLLLIMIMITMMPLLHF